MASPKNTFHWADYVIFILTLVISALVGIFFAWKDKRNQSTANFLLGGRQMSILPVTLSLMATFLSAVLVLGVPTEIFYNGTMYWLICFSNFLTFPIAAHGFLPVFHKLELTSAYEYLALRFSKSVQVLGSVIFILQMILYMAVVLYAPAIALNQVMGIDLLVSILAIGLICTFYTAVGGLKAVMWTDAFQMVIVFAGVLAVAVKGMQEVGGFDVVWETAKNGSKLHADNFDPNPLERHTFWTLVIGGFVTSLTIYASNQAMIQRYLSMESVKRAQITLYLQLPGALVFTSLLVFTGMVLYAKYHDNDPVQLCLVNKRDQLIPWLVMDILGQYHGFPGLMVACIFSASLSTVSSGVNALALVCLTDLLKPLYTKITKKSLDEKKLTIISKVLAVIFGLITIGLAFLAQMFGKLILQVTLSIFGMVGGPLLGLIICAMFVPMVNHWGALVGVVTSICITSWIAIGSIAYTSGLSPPNPCEAPNNSTLLNNTTYNTTYNTVHTSTVITTHLSTTSVGDNSYDPLSTIYRLSYMWYSTLAVLVTVVVGVLVSCVTGGTRKAPVDHRLLSPFYLALSNMARVVNVAEIEETVKKLDEYDLDKKYKKKNQIYDEIMTKTNIEMEIVPNGNKERL